MSHHLSCNEESLDSILNSIDTNVHGLDNLHVHLLSLSELDCVSEKLNKEQSSFYFAYTWLVQIGTAGFHSYYYEMYGGYSYEAISAFRTFSVDPLADLALQANGEFPGGIVPSNNLLRRKLLTSIEDEAMPNWLKLEDESFFYYRELTDKMILYIKENAEAFRYYPDNL